MPPALTPPAMDQVTDPVTAKSGGGGLHVVRTHAVWPIEASMRIDERSSNSIPIVWPTQ